MKEDIDGEIVASCVVSHCSRRSNQSKHIHDWSHHCGMPDELVDSLHALFKTMRTDIKRDRLRAQLRDKMKGDPFADLFMTPEQR